MPKKFSHQNPPEPDEYRRRAVKLFDSGEVQESNRGSSASVPDDENDESPNGDFELEAETKRSKIRTVKDYALYLVSVNTYTERKLRDKLASKKRAGVSVYSQSEIDEALEYLKGFGYINDERLAQNSLPSLAARMWGKLKIRFYLIKNGIDEDIVDSLDYSDIDFIFYCRKLLSKYSGKPRDKQFRALYNAGYSADEIREVMGDLLSL